MNRTYAMLNLTAAVLMMGLATAHADDGLHGVTHLGEHPAVLVARHGVSSDPSANFYLHPARMSWSLSRPLEAGEHPAVVIAHRAATPAIDPNQFIPAHPAGGASSGRPSH